MEAVAELVVARLQASEAHKKQQASLVGKKAKTKGLKCRARPLSSSSSSPSSSSESEIPRAPFLPKKSKWPRGKTPRALRTKGCSTDRSHRGAKRRVALDPWDSDIQSSSESSSEERELSGSDEGLLGSN